MVRRKDRKRGPQQQSLRPRGAGVYAIIEGDEVTGGDDEVAKPSKQTLPGTGPSKKARANVKKPQETLPGTGPARARSKASRKETLIGTGTGKATSGADTKPAQATMPRNSEAPPAPGPLPWSGDSDGRVEVEIAPTPPAGEVAASAPSPEQPRVRDAMPHEDTDTVEREPRKAIEKPPKATEPPSKAAEQPPKQAAPRAAKPRRKSPVATIALAVVATAAVLYVVIRPGSSRSDGDSAPAPAATEAPAPAAEPSGRTAAPTSAQKASADATGDTAIAAADATATGDDGADAPDGSELPPHQGYLEITGPSAQLYVYGRGKRLGKTTDRLQVRCGAVTIRLGDRAPKHWYSEPERIRVACQKVTTVEVEPIDPVSILEDGVPAGSATAEASVAPAAPRRPPAPRPSPTPTGPDWAPPSI